MVILTHVPNVLLLLHVEQPLLGPLWFVPMFLVSKIIFSALFQWAENRRVCNVAHVAVVAVCGVLGLYMNHEGLFLLYNMQTAMLSISSIFLRLSLSWMIILTISSHSRYRLLRSRRDTVICSARSTKPFDENGTGKYNVSSA